MTELERQKNREYQKKYFQKNKEVLYAKAKIRYANRTEEEKKLDKIKRKEYYEQNKEKVAEGQKKYRINNREKFNKIIHNYRKRKAQEFKEQGQMYCFYPKTERENKMVEKLAYKKNIPNELSRELLIKNDWNIKKLLNEEVINNA